MRGCEERVGFDVGITFFSGCGCNLVLRFIIGIFSQRFFMGADSCTIFKRKLGAAGNIVWDTTSAEEMVIAPVYRHSLVSVYIVLYLGGLEILLFL